MSVGGKKNEEELDDGRWWPVAQHNMAQIFIEVSGNELNKILLLLLGCAVQSAKKEAFVSRITKLEKFAQQGIAREIQKITESSSIVLSIDSLTRYGDKILDNVEKLIEQRDAYAQTFFQMGDTESDGGGTSTEGSSVSGDFERTRKCDLRPGRRTPSPSYLDRHSTVELSAKNAELRKLRKETEDKDDRINELTDELQASEAEVRKLKEERIELVKDARAAKDLRDELDCVQQKLDKLDKLERENSHLHEKLSKLAYVQTQLEHQRADNRALETSIEQLESELEILREEKKTHIEARTRLDEAQQSMRCLQTDICEKNSKIEELLVEQSRLESELMCLNGKILEMERLNESANHLGHESFGSLADEMADSERSEVVQLRSENRKLRLLVDSTNISLEQSKKLEQMRIEQEQREKDFAETKAENELIQRQLHTLEITLSQLNNKISETEMERDELRKDRDESVMSLIDARKKFAQFQAEFCCKFEQEAQSKTEMERDELRKDRDESVMSLIDARKKFAQFQAEFCCKFEQEAQSKVMEVETELQDVRRKLSAVVEERKQTEKQLHRVCEDQKSLQTALDKLSEEKENAETQNSYNERARRSVEKERNALRTRIEALSVENDELKERVRCAEDAKRRLESNERRIAEQQGRIGDLEAECRTIKQQMALESQKTQRLREDLVTEKSRTAELVGRLRSVCAAIALNGGKIESQMSDNELIDSIDNVIMGALSAAKREADALRLQQHTQIAELNDLKGDIEKLRRSESVSLNESDDRVRELSKENVALKEQVFLVQEKVREQQVEIAAKNSEVVAAKREIEELHRNARWKLDSAF
ncbi:hypothetical protein DICVIV_05201 [Dictyocaulus viviparus]|uniref:HOOK N-terminal domain-containing protein n=1 Tax=Dictyocaulus viviparus TaxID=29172 RepID=A0A0D8XW38_DICVI|nr:hypothetical protein DICVIV_05201 [Dictyocaulus viviparus]